MNRQELLKRVGSVEQIGGIREFTFNSGKERGVRAIEINTGKIRFTVLPDRCIDVEHTGDVATAGIENGEIGAYITYERKNLPDFLVWKMLGESEYVVGLEPRTSSKGGENIAKNNEYVQVKPFEEYKTNLKFSFKTL